MGIQVMTERGQGEKCRPNGIGIEIDLLFFLDYRFSKAASRKFQSRYLNSVRMQQTENGWKEAYRSQTETPKWLPHKNRLVMRQNVIVWDVQHDTFSSYSAIT